jgi:ketosteroid isomerase-like protein
LTSDEQVAAVIDVTLTAKVNGKRIEYTEIRLWTFGADGKVVAVRHLVDTLQHAEAQSA